MTEPRKRGRKPIIDRALAIALRKAGMTYRAIGEAFGVSVVSVFYAINPSRKLDFDGPWEPTVKRGSAHAAQVAFAKRVIAGEVSLDEAASSSPAEAA